MYVLAQLLSQAATIAHRIVTGSQNLVLTLGIFSFLAAIFTALSFYVAIEPRISLMDPLAIQVETLLPLWVFAIAGFPGQSRARRSPRFAER